METVFNLHFDIGNIRCSLVSANPFYRFSTLTSAHYEHSHHHFELHFVQEGSCAFLCDGAAVTVSPSELLLLPPKLYHKVDRIGGSCSKLCLSFSILRDERETNADDDRFYEAFYRNRQPVVLSGSPALTEKLSEINRLLEAPKSFLTREQLRVACNSFLLLLYICLSEEKESAAVYDTSPTDEYIIDNFFALNFMSNSSKELLAEKIHVSPRQLQRILKNKYGKNYREKMAEIRIAVATGFLRNSDKKISEISEILGYSTPANFATFLKKATGMTPGQIRKNRG